MLDAAAMELDPYTFGKEQTCFGCGPHNPVGWRLRFRREGDEVVTSGGNGIFPRGLRVGHVLSAQGRGGSLFQEGIVETSASLDRTEEVIILPLSQPPVGPVEALEPDRP